MSSGKFTLAFEDSNIAAMGSEEDASARKSAAESEEAWRGCGSKPGIQVWRIEQFKVCFVKNVTCRIEKLTAVDGSHETHLFAEDKS
jgi:hypothetical protein